MNHFNRCENRKALGDLSAEQSGRNTDGDSLIDLLDPDDDNDAVNGEDRFSDPTEWVDTRRRSGNNETTMTTMVFRYDQFPLDETEWEDNDMDGIGNNADEDDDNDAAVLMLYPDPFETLIPTVMALATTLTLMMTVTV